MRTEFAARGAGAIEGAREWIGKQLGARYLPASPNVYKGKKAAQECARSDSAYRCVAYARVDCALPYEEQLKLYRSSGSGLCFADDSSDF